MVLMVHYVVTPRLHIHSPPSRPSSLLPYLVQSKLASSEQSGLGPQCPTAAGEPAAHHVGPRHASGSRRLPWRCRPF